MNSQGREDALGIPRRGLLPWGPEGAHLGLATGKEFCQTHKVTVLQSEGNARRKAQTAGFL